MKNSNVVRQMAAWALVVAWVGNVNGEATPPPTPPILGSLLIEIPPRDPRETGYRPKAPSMQSVTYTYDDGNLYFEFAIPEGQCQLILSDLSTGETVVAGFDSDVTEPVYVGYHSTASLTVTTANGHTYTGEW